MHSDLKNSGPNPRTCATVIITCACLSLIYCENTPTSSTIKKSGANVQKKVFDDADIFGERCCIKLEIVRLGFVVVVVTDGLCHIIF